MSTTLIPASSNPKPANTGRPEWPKIQELIEDAKGRLFRADLALRCRRPDQVVQHTSQLRADLLLLLALAERLADL